MLRKTRTGIAEENTDLEIRSYLELYFNGSIDRIIAQKQQKMEQGLDESYYNTLNAVWDGDVKVNGGSMYSDPTGGRATLLASYYYELQYTIDFLTDVKQEMEKLQLTAAEEDILRAKLNLGGSYAQVKREHGVTRTTILKKKNKLLSKVTAVIEPLLNEYISKLD